MESIESWCDKLASTPAVGLRFEKSYVPAEHFLAGLAPILNLAGDEYESGFQINKVEPFSVELVDDQGFQYGIDHSRIYVEFKHRLRLKNISGGPPTVEMISKPSHYTALLEQLSEKILNLVPRVFDLHARKLTRIGVISSTTVDEIDAPPGIRRFVEHIAAPWKAELSEYQMRLLIPLEESSRHRDRCFHQLSKLENSDGLGTYNFDFQRTLKSPAVLSLDQIKRQLHETKSDALRYFETIGAGYVFD